jgi:hypothetical protein
MRPVAIAIAHFTRCEHKLDMMVSDTRPCFTARDAAAGLRPLETLHA